MKSARKSWIVRAFLALSLGLLSCTTGHSAVASDSSSRSYSWLDDTVRPFTRNLQPSASTFTNPRAPSRRSPDDVAEPNSISQEELQALLLSKSSSSSAGLSSSNNREGGDDEDDDNYSRTKLLLFVILIPTSAFVLGACILFRVSKRNTRGGGRRTETEGLFQTRDENEFVITQPAEQPYRDVPKQGFAERRPNVI